MVAAWLLCFILFIFTAALLTALLFNHSAHSSDGWHALIENIKERLQGNSLKVPQSRYPVELWVWDNSEEEDPCEESIERAAWAPMDIADWMKEGMPQTPESGTEMCEGCNCRLVRCTKKSRGHYKP